MEPALARFGPASFAVVRDGKAPLRDLFADALVAELLGRGFTEVPPSDGARFVLNVTRAARPRPFRRRSKSVCVVTLVDAPATGAAADPSLRSACYAALVRSLSNLLLCAVEPAADGARGGAPEAYLTTPEAGFSHLPFDAARVCDLMLPIAAARFATDNEVSEDLPRSLCGPSPVVESLAAAGRTLGALGVLPLPFPVRDVLSPRDLRHLHRLFGIRGLSYGNLSARERGAGLRQPAFWMTGRGVDKARITTVGKDVLLVTGRRRGLRPAIRVSVPPGADPLARVSVDAIEHCMVYEEFEDVEAIVHVHAWMDGVPSTRQAHPCGTVELAEEVAGLLRATPDPSRAAIGLRNHGLTITGRSLAEIFERIAGRLRLEVPMFA